MGREAVTGSVGRGVAVRTAGDADIAALAALRRAWTAEQRAARHDPVPHDPGFEQRFQEWLAREGGRRVCWLAEIGGEAVGMVNLSLFERMPRPGRPPSRWGYLGNAFVLAGHRDAGVGAALVEALLAYARSEALVRVVLSPSARSVPFYERAGFRRADELMMITLG